MTKQNDKYKEIKEMYLTYLEDVPVHKWASKYCRISEDTSKRMRDDDPEFAEACEAKISAFVRRTAKRAKPEFQLERLLRDDFAQRTEVTGKHGEALIPKPLLSNVPDNDSTQEAEEVK